jgi:membrane-associated protein
MHYVVPALGPDWLDPQYILDALGPWALWGAVAIIFAECGLLIGFCLPGDSLLFTVGLLTTTGVIKEPLWLGCVLLIVAAFAGNAVGYEIGRRTGPAIFKKENSRVFKKEYVDKTIAFFDKYGSRAIVLARFVPIVRTFITVTAGVGQMDRRRYLTYSGIGGTLWAGGVAILGSLLGSFEFVKNNLEVILLSIVLVSVVPMIIEFLREQAKSRRAASGSPGETSRFAPGEPDDPTTRPHPISGPAQWSLNDFGDHAVTAPPVPIPQAPGQPTPWPPSGNGEVPRWTPPSPWSPAPPDPHHPGGGRHAS